MVGSALIKSIAMAHFADAKMKRPFYFSVMRSVARFCDFLKFVAVKFLAKEAHMIGNFLGIFENLTLM